MRAEIFPSSPSGEIRAPASKSHIHRLLLAAGLGGGTSVIKNACLSQDIEATVRCLTALGARVSFDSGTFTVTGFGGEAAANARLDCGECGTAARFFIPVCLLSGERTTLTGSPKLLSRPMDVYEDIAREQGLEFNNSGEEITLRGKLRPGNFAVKGNISSQFISGLLFALPLAHGDSRLEIIPPFESRPYVDMTLEALSAAGVNIEREGELVFGIKGGAVYRPFEAKAQGDWSNAAFLWALRYLGNDVTVTGTDSRSLQGDRVCTEYFEKIRNGFCTLDLADFPDLAPVMFTFAGLCSGAEFTGTERLKIKESDRVGELGEELEKAGIELVSGENRVRIIPRTVHAPAVPFSSHNDHRIAMALAVLCTVTGGVIDGAQAVAKSYPAFFESLAKAGVKIKYDS